MWSKEDDCNTSFFHRMPNAHRRRNRLPKVKVNDGWHTEENEIKASVVRAFHNLFSEEGGWRPSIDGLTFEDLDSHKAKKLELPFSEEVVFAALFDLGKDKALGPNGHTMAFLAFQLGVCEGRGVEFFLGSSMREANLLSLQMQPSWFLFQIKDVLKT